jgi:hypothetical protein
MKPKRILPELDGEEIQRLKKKHKEMYGKPAPPFCIWEDPSVEEYKEKLKKLVKEK